MMTRSMKIHTLIVLAAALSALLLSAAVSVAKNQHPVELTGAPICRDCHTDWRSALDHTQDFSTRHKFSAVQQKATCQVCHVESFCADCHANKEELKPSDKYKDSPERAMPHRGDYLTQHRIDGRINPASCFPCHGRQNNARCKACHL